MKSSLASPYPARSAFIQFFCPAPKRYLQSLVLKYGLKTGLDIGCGGGSPLTSLRGPGFTSTGIDIDAKSIERARASGLHDSYVLGDFMTMDLKTTFDVVVLSHVIEHFDRDTGLLVLQRLEQLSSHLIYVETPNGFLEQADFDGNPFQRHLSGWFPQDLSSRCYTVFGSGPKWLLVPMGQKHYIPDSIRRILSRGLQWYYYRRPSKAGVIAGIRYRDEAGNMRAA
jgi:SAM-dependent methyltransferase